MAKKKKPQLKITQKSEYKDGSTIGFAARLVVQGRHRFYSMAMPSDLLGETCSVDTREENPDDGFQRLLDQSRAQDIADYVDSGFGTIPVSIVLSAQPTAKMEYDSRSQTVRFKKAKSAFLILDGQHRVFGFRLAKTRINVPVAIYNGLSKSEEARLFIDINTKQRPVPNELLLDIKRMADTENELESLFRDVFDLFADDPDSPLRGLMSPSTRSRGKISRVTFNAALKPIWLFLGDADADYVYDALSAYLHAWTSYLSDQGLQENITNSTLLRGIMLFFPTAAEKVADKFGRRFSTDNFRIVLRPVFQRISKATLKRPGGSPTVLADNFKKAIQANFSLGRS